MTADTTVICQRANHQVPLCLVFLSSTLLLSCWHPLLLLKCFITANITLVKVCTLINLAQFMYTLQPNQQSKQNLIFSWLCIIIQLCIKHQLDAQVIVYSYNVTFLYMFRAISARLQEVILYTCSIWYRHCLRAVVVFDRYTGWVRVSSHSTCVLIRHHTLSQRVTVPYAACIQYDLLKMSTYCSKHVQECNIIWINNNLCIKLVFNT